MTTTPKTEALTIELSQIFDKLKSAIAGRHYDEVENHEVVGPFMECIAKRCVFLSENQELPDIFKYCVYCHSRFALLKSALRKIKKAGFRHIEDIEDTEAKHE